MKTRKTVLLTADWNYFPMAMFTAWIVDQNHPQRDFDICLASIDTLPDHPLIQKLGVRVLRLEPPDVTAPTTHRIPATAYLRLSAPEALKHDYDRILYMDCDMLHIRGDLSRLMQVDLGPHALAAVRDDAQLRNHRRVPRDFRALGIGFHKYLNSGFLLIDTADFCARGIGRQALELAVARSEAMIYHDQSALNAVLKGDWAELPLVWNFQFCQKTLYFAVHFRPAILHFITSQKPWKSRYGIYPGWILDLYRGFFQTHFPVQYAAMQDLPASDARPGIQRLLLLIHAISARKYLANLTRFSDEWDVRY